MKRIFILISFFLSQCLFAHNEQNMRRELYSSHLVQIWNEYENAVSLEQKRLAVEQLKLSLKNQESATPVSQLKDQQKKISMVLVNSAAELEEELKRPDSDSKRRDSLEHQLQLHIFEYLEFEKTISDFKSEQLWKMMRSLLVILTVFILATIVLTYFYNNAKRRAKKQIEFNNKIILVQEEERQRLSRELHDTVTQDIRTSLLFVRELKDRNSDFPEEDKVLVQKIEMLESQNLVNIRNIIRNLTPPEIESSNLRSLLTELCANVMQIAKINCTFYADGSLDFTKLTNIQKLNIYRIIQESVNNAIKHAKASEINILARKKSKNGSGFVFFVSDDGCGFNPEKIEPKNSNDLLNKSTHLGIQGMKTRAQLINADLVIMSDDECGTEIRLAMEC